jgi:hypothetical protein
VKALTLHPEWAFAVHKLGKRVENRSWKPPEHLWRGPFAIHAGKSIGGKPGLAATLAGLDDVAEMANHAGWWVGLLSEGYRFRLGTDAPWIEMAPRTVTTSAILGVATLTSHVATNVTGLPWKVLGQHGWVFEYHPLPTPIPCRGAQGLWTVPGDALRQIREALPDVFDVSNTPATGPEPR